VVTLDEIQVDNYEGVEHLHLRKFLSESFWFFKDISNWTASGLFLKPVI
jgi:hypothetical protein